MSKKGSFYNIQTCHLNIRNKIVLVGTTAATIYCEYFTVQLDALLRCIFEYSINCIIYLSKKKRHVSKNKKYVNKNKKYVGKKKLNSKCGLRHRLADVNPFVPTVAFSQLSSNICCPETASLGIMGEPRKSPLNLSETIVLSEHYRLWGSSGGTRGSPIMPRDAVSRTANVGTVGTNGLRSALHWAKIL